MTDHRQLLERARDWIRGDKWRFSDAPGQRESWEKFIGELDAALSPAAPAGGESVPLRLPTSAWRQAYFELHGSMSDALKLEVRAQYYAEVISSNVHSDKGK